MDTPTLADWIAEVRADFQAHHADYLAEAQSRVEGVVDVELIGSYASGDARDESDVDMLVTHTGPMSEDEVYALLAGQVIGLAGVFDIIPRKISSD